MSEHLVDTDWAVDVLHGQHTAVQTLISLAPGGLAVSVITYGELFEGAYYARDRQTAMNGLTAFLQGKDILPLTLPVLERFAIERGLIAATALHHDLTLLTRNRRDFSLISGLKLYQPTP